MLWRIPTENGVVPALKTLFMFLQEHRQTHVIYFNCTSSAALQAVARSLPHTETLKHFEYQRVSSVGEIMGFLSGQNHWVVVEHVDAIVQEPSDLSYAELNRDISALMNTGCNVVFLDDWPYLDQYWHRETVGVRV